MDRFSFDDSIRFEEDSLCSWSSEAESLCNNWRGWKKPSNCSITMGPGNNGIGLNPGTGGPVAHATGSSGGGATYGSASLGYGGAPSGTGSSNGVANNSSATVTAGVHCGRYFGEYIFNDASSFLE
ncbi:GH17249 [Drosophila grimshawi]|uniref:GH17249 n=1 Tax=Drosophila grimshawi TaxID=7222 RepID=B4JWU7_DROGR|nr:GH17249 [Drosophila grimshawi]